MVAAEADLTTEQIVDELMSLLMAAQEPPSIALTWILDRLARDPELATEFLADPRGRRADAVVRETLRLRPPASGALRRLLAPEPERMVQRATVLVPRRSLLVRARRRG